MIAMDKFCTRFLQPKPKTSLQWPLEATSWYINKNNQKLRQLFFPLAFNFTIETGAENSNRVTKTCLVKRKNLPTLSLCRLKTPPRALLILPWTLPHQPSSLGCQTIPVSLLQCTYRPNTHTLSHISHMAKTNVSLTRACIQCSSVRAA
jgi:hypothetical protein